VLFRSKEPVVVVGEERLAALYVRALAQRGIAAEVVAGEAAIVEGFRRLGDA
jgi:2-keto-3-deoxy-galactonokinase